jgi:hypothetical protein
MRGSSFNVLRDQQRQRDSPAQSPAIRRDRYRPTTRDRGRARPPDRRPSFVDKVTVSTGAIYGRAANLPLASDPLLTAQKDPTLVLISGSRD